MKNLDWFDWLALAGAIAACLVFILLIWNGV